MLGTLHRTMEDMEHLDNKKDWVWVRWLDSVPGQALWIRGSFEKLWLWPQVLRIACTIGSGMLAFGKAEMQYDSINVVSHCDLAD